MSTLALAPLGLILREYSPPNSRGSIWPFRSRLDASGITGGYSENDENQENGKKKYYRVWKNIDVTQEAMQQRFFDMLSSVFKNVVMRVLLDSNPKPDTHVAAFVERLRREQSLFFVEQQVVKCTIESSQAENATAETQGVDSE